MAAFPCQDAVALGPFFGAPCVDGEGCRDRGGSLTAPKVCVKQQAEAGGHWGKHFKSIHHPWDAALQDAAAIGVLTPLPALAPCPPLVLQLRHPRDPKGHHHLICKILGWWNSFQLVGRGSGLSRGQPGTGWGHQHKPQGPG